jgi:hypothetical protein
MTALDEPPPYRPGIGSAPEPLFGRDQILDPVYEVLRSADRGYGGGMVRLVGLHGTGKTTLLSHLEKLTTDPEALGPVLGHDRVRPWVVLRGESSPDIDLRLIERARRLGRDLTTDGGRWNVTFGATAGIASVNVQRGAADAPERTASLYGTLSELSEAAAEQHRPVLVLIDELQTIREDILGAITAVVNERSGSEHPLVLVTAELPNRLDLEHLTYFRDRAQQLSVDSLSLPATLSAIDAPARALGVIWDQDALQTTARASAGYPYAVQVYAHAAWRAAPPGDRITLEAARAGVGDGFEQMSRLYRSRWDGLTDRQRQYLGALGHIAPNGASVPTASVAVALGDPITSWSGDLATLRDRQGAVVHAQQKVRLALPGWSRWIIDLQHREPFLADEVVARAEQFETDAEQHLRSRRTRSPGKDG